jgi:hypothetical protein
MAVRWVWGAVPLIVFVVLVMGSRPIWAQAQDPIDLDALNRQVIQLYQAGKYAEATGIGNVRYRKAESEGSCVRGFCRRSAHQWPPSTITC